MAILRKSSKESAPSPPQRGKGDENAISIIGPGMTIEGDLDTDGVVRVEGRVLGGVRAGKAVVIGRGGEIEGDVVTQDAVVGGTVRGTIVAESRLELQAGCVVEGEIRTRPEHLKLDEGALFNGRIEMSDEPAAPPALPPSEEQAFPRNEETYPQQDYHP